MVKKIYVLSVVLCFAVQNMQAQFENLFKSQGQQLVEQAVRDGFSVIRQEYRLRDISKEEVSYFGRHGNDYFGRCYVLGIRINGGYYVDKEFVEPWDSDVNYEKYKSNKSLEPEVSKAEIQGIAGDFEPLKYSVKKESDNLVFIVDSSRKKGFSVNGEIGKIDGWIVLATSENISTENDSMSLSFEIYRKTIEISSRKTVYGMDKPTMDKRVLGGAFFYPEITAVGQITFRLVGIICRRGEHWQIVTLNEFTEKNINDELNPI